MRRKESRPSLDLERARPGRRTVATWERVLTRDGPTPVGDTPGSGNLPEPDEITADARSDSSGECSWPPWRHGFNPDPDRQQARRVLRRVHRSRHPTAGPGPRPACRRAASARADGAEITWRCLQKRWQHREDGCCQHSFAIRQFRLGSVYSGAQKYTLHGSIE
jgi:hypothetical protein